jgi:hypothetical protein
VFPDVYCHDEKVGSRMPIDTTIHWQWHNPLNIFPATLLILLVFAIIGACMDLGLF